MPSDTVRISFDDVMAGVQLLGLVGFIDPPRLEAKEAIAECRSAGIDVKMITGDHAATALAIARQLDLADDPQVMTGLDVEKLSDGDLEGVVNRVSVFARTSPEHKLRIVRALQAQGQIVAMTGDGVNDAPSLKQADVGVAMGIKGTEASKEAASMVLLDDNFASIVSAVREGRTVYDNIRKVISWEIPTNGGETLAVVLAILLGFALPMSATQILWVNLILAATLGLVLAFEPTEPGAMQRRPRERGAPLLSPFLLWRVVLVSVLFAAVTLGIFFYTLDQGRGLEVASTMVVNMFIVAELFYLFRWRQPRSGGSISSPAHPLAGCSPASRPSQGRCSAARASGARLSFHPSSSGASCWCRCCSPRSRSASSSTRSIRGAASKLRARWSSTCSSSRRSSTSSMSAICIQRL